MQRGIRRFLLFRHIRLVATSLMIEETIVNFDKKKKKKKKKIKEEKEKGKEGTEGNKSKKKNKKEKVSFFNAIKISK